MPLTYREAVRLILACGGTLRSHGARHDVFRAPNGSLIAVPRHKGDLTLGVERDIKHKLGLVGDGQEGGLDEGHIRSAGLQG